MLGYVRKTIPSQSKWPSWIGSSSKCLKFFVQLPTPILPSLPAFFRPTHLSLQLGLSFIFWCYARCYSVDIGLQRRDIGLIYFVLPLAIVVLMGTVFYFNMSTLSSHHLGVLFTLACIEKIVFSLFHRSTLFATPTSASKMVRNLTNTFTKAIFLPQESIPAPLPIEDEGPTLSLQEKVKRDIQFVIMTTGQAGFQREKLPFLFDTWLKGYEGAPSPPALQQRRAIMLIGYLFRYHSYCK
jgi:hypothetical protein